MIRRLCHVDQLPAEGQLKLFVDNRPGSPVALCVGVLDGKPYAVDNVCPHQRAPLAAGHLDGANVACPVHGWRWSLVDGTAYHQGDPDIASYELRQYGSDVLVRLPAHVECRLQTETCTKAAATVENTCKLSPWSATR